MIYLKTENSGVKILLKNTFRQMILNFNTSFTLKKKFILSIYPILYLFLFISCNQEEKTTISPNIIWLVAEDQSPEFLPMYGDLTTKLPYLSNLAKDGVVCMWVQGKFEDNTYTWVNALVGKLDNSKSWCSSAEFHQANKTWIQSIGGTKFQLEFIKSSAIDTFFTGIHNAGICLGTLSTQDFDSMGSIQMKVMTWVY